MTYRIAGESDLDKICELIKSAIEEMETHKIFQWDEIYPVREDFLNDIKSSSLYIGEIDKRIAIVYAINKEADEEYKKADWRYNGEYRVVHRFCVHPDFQNRGLARKTLAYIETQATSLGAKSLRLDVFSKNPFALRLYEHADYRKMGETTWRKGLFFLMEKEI